MPILNLNEFMGSVTEAAKISAGTGMPYMMALRQANRQKEDALHAAIKQKEAEQRQAMYAAGMNTPAPSPDLALLLQGMGAPAARR